MAFQLKASGWQSSTYLSVITPYLYDTGFGRLLGFKFLALQLLNKTAVRRFVKLA
jgi:hypothetical protein